jgi:hypothetical protein
MGSASGGETVRRVAAIVAIMSGAVLIVMPVASSLFSRSRSADRLADGVRPAMTRQALAADRAGLDGLARALPKVGGSEARLVQAGFVPHTELVLTTLENNRTRFETADSFPVGGVSPRVGPWIFIGFGITLVIVGLVTLRTTGRAAPLALLALGVVGAVAAFAFSLPHKASATDELVDRLKPAFAEQSVRRVPGELATVQKFARQVGNTPEDPHLSTDVATFTALGTALVQDRHFYTETAKIPSRTLVWLMIALCLVVAAGAAPAVRRAYLH